jgi:hypothetical protein
MLNKQMGNMALEFKVWSGDINLLTKCGEVEYIPKKTY